ncbi:MAG: hypothetical protein ACI8X5_000892 [Planctomycetota bacterium]
MVARSQTIKIHVNDPSPYDEYGTSVAIRGDAATFGSFSHDPNKVYVIDLTSGFLSGFLSLLRMAWSTNLAIG